jgi:hypothetical protein
MVCSSPSGCRLSGTAPPRWPPTGRTSGCPSIPTSVRSRSTGSPARPWTPGLRKLEASGSADGQGGLSARTVCYVYAILRLGIGRRGQAGTALGQPDRPVDTTEPVGGPAPRRGRRGLRSSSAAASAEPTPRIRSLPWAGGYSRPPACAAVRRSPHPAAGRRRAGEGRPGAWVTRAPPSRSPSTSTCIPAWAARLQTASRRCSRADPRRKITRYHEGLRGLDSKRPQAFNRRNTGVRLCPRGDSLHTHTVATVTLIPQRSGMSC